MKFSATLRSSVLFAPLRRLLGPKKPTANIGKPTLICDTLAFSLSLSPTPGSLSPSSNVSDDFMTFSLPTDSELGSFAYTSPASPVINGAMVYYEEDECVALPSHAVDKEIVGCSEHSHSIVTSGPEENALFHYASGTDVHPAAGSLYMGFSNELSSDYGPFSPAQKEALARYVIKAVLDILEDPADDDIVAMRLADAVAAQTYEDMLTSLDATFPTHILEPDFDLLDVPDYIAGHEFLLEEPIWAMLNDDGRLTN